MGPIVKLVVDPEYIYCEECDIRVCDNKTRGVQDPKSGQFKCLNCWGSGDIDESVGTILKIVGLIGKSIPNNPSVINSKKEE
jgi:hypothetical protein